MNKVYLLLGSNEGDRMQWMLQAINVIATFATVEKQSSVYETAAWGKKDQPDFLNMVIEISTDNSSRALLHNIQKTELVLGRQREVKWGQRTLDIDILFFNNEIINTDTLKVPHPFLQDRRFTLEPLNEIAENLVHPVVGKKVGKLLEECEDKLVVRKMEIEKWF
ncbi:MAG TPA: 2-amino-4-hydroxy-6-hydroxymethyldihydropteridine diphosphokinase [Flavipsychrobacter sp.]|nr:2-amino-4-hydroxy-6-hydroxymethyldihydropteridine diphosphokinase [Flavipsychrobacter sp.]